MAVQRYLKQRPIAYHPKERVHRKQAFARRVLLLHRLAPIFLVSVGIILLGSVVFPILSSQLLPETQLRAGAQEEMVDNPELIEKLKVRTHREDLLPTPKPTPMVIATELSYLDLADWFPEHQVPIVAPQEAKKYYITIPTLHIEDAEVVYGGRNLDQHLIQYPETAMPGEYGAPVIFGHSILRQFYNPKKDNPRRYISVFSTIMTLKKGDAIYVRDEKITYTYRVSEKSEVQPTDRYILEQQLNVRQLKLVTCTPEGTTLRRGVVIATLEE